MEVPADDAPPLLDAAGLRAVLAARGAPRSGECSVCNVPRCEGWESVPAPIAPPRLACVGTLRDPAIEEPTLTERHTDGPGGTHYWHPRAPIAVAHHPCNRCTVWQCEACGRGFLQYTEFGGYYVDHRIRAIDPALITD